MWSSDREVGRNTKYRMVSLLRSFCDCLVFAGCRKSSVDTLRGVFELSNDCANLLDRNDGGMDPRAVVASSLYRLCYEGRPHARGSQSLSLRPISFEALNGGQCKSRRLHPARDLACRGWPVVTSLARRLIVFDQGYSVKVFLDRLRTLQL